MSISDACGQTVLPADTLVAVIAGGDTAEYESSIASGFNVFNCLRSTFPSVLLRVRHGEWSVLRDESRGLLGADPKLTPDLRFLGPSTGARVKPDTAVLCTHGFPGETGELQGLLTMAGIPFCSSGVLPSAMAADKFRCSQYLHSLCDTQIPRQQRLTSAQLGAAARHTADWPSEDWPAADWPSADWPSDWRTPFVLKPVSLGSALGVLSVHEIQGMSAGFSEAAAQRCDYVIQEFIDGIEITTGAVRFRNHEVRLPSATVLRTDSPGELGVRHFADHKSVQLVIPADLPNGINSQVHDAMRRIGETLGLFGFYRADFIWSAGCLYFLEVNTIPGLSENSVFTRLVDAAGLELGELLGSLILEAVR